MDAAHALFAERGFDGVAVDDIAELAEVGRTTFFRYFGDKQEVVFANEQRGLEDLAAQHHVVSELAAHDLAQAVGQLQPLVTEICVNAVRDPDRWRLHEQLLAQHVELSDRNEGKLQRYAEVLTGILISRGADTATATLAAQLALACYGCARRLASDEPTTLLSALTEAFDQLTGAVLPRSSPASVRAGGDFR